MAIVTLLSDLGTADAAAGIVKGILYSKVPGARITDISHEVSPFDTEQAAYILASAHTGFPPGTVHVVLVDIFAEVDTRLLLAARDGHYFLLPDNDMLQMAFPDARYEAWACKTGSGEHKYDAWLYAVAGIITDLANRAPAEMGLQSMKLTSITPAVPKDAPVVICRILYIDHFGNIVTDMTRERFQRLNRNNNFSTTIGGDTIRTVSNTYTEVQKGELLCRFNRRGYLEICMNKGDASAKLGLWIGGIRNEIKMIFE